MAAVAAYYDEVKNNMVKISSTILVLLLTVLVSPVAFSQNAATITADFSGLNFQQFVDKVEAGYPYHFFFDANETDSVK